MTPPFPRARPPRRSVLLAAAGAALLAGCAGAPLAPLRLYQLRAPTPDAPPTPFDGVLTVGPVQLPDYLDRSAIVVRSGAAGLSELPGQRWAEPLPQAFARVLTQGLAARLGPSRVWAEPLPAALQPTRQLRVDVLRFDADAGSRRVVLAARWAIVAEPGAAAPPPPQVEVGEWAVEAAAADVDALVAAHSALVARLVDAIVASLRGAAAAPVAPRAG